MAYAATPATSPFGHVEPDKALLLILGRTMDDDKEAKRRHDVEQPEWARVARQVGTVDIELFGHPFSSAREACLFAVYDFCRAITRSCDGSWPAEEDGTLKLIAPTWHEFKSDIDSYKTVKEKANEYKRLRSAVLAEEAADNGSKSIDTKPPKNRGDDQAEDELFAKAAVLLNRDPN